VSYGIKFLPEPPRGTKTGIRIGTLENKNKNKNKKIKILKKKNLRKSLSLVSILES
jgi:hypothetical protein